MVGVAFPHMYSITKMLFMQIAIFILAIVSLVLSVSTLIITKRRDKLEAEEDQDQGENKEE